MANPIYTVEKITSDGVQVRYENDSWAVLPITENMEVADIDDLALQYAPKSYSAPDFLSVGTQRSAVAIEPEGKIVPIPEWKQARLNDYGTIESQIEFITENGLDKWQEKVAKIKADNPKP